MSFLDVTGNYIKINLFCISVGCDGNDIAGQPTVKYGNGRSVRIDGMGQERRHDLLNTEKRYKWI